MNQKVWKIEEQEESVIAQLCDTLEISPIVARLLYNRGFYEPIAAGRFLRKETGVFHDPFLLRDMDRAVARIRAAVDAGERITVYGDYDADGVTATSVLFLYLASIGADVHFYIPGRFDEGYGLNTDAVKKLAADGTHLIVTVDTGVTAVDEVAFANACGMDVVITDHHTCRPILPDAVAVVNPHRADDTYPFKELAGVGVAFKLICAIECADMTEIAQKKEATRRLCMEYAEYTAIGTIADVMPLRDENRLIVNIGLALLQQTQKPGLIALMDVAAGQSCTASADSQSAQSRSERPKYVKKRKVTSSFISFTIAPRINAIGRISSAARAVELFLTDSLEYANRLANELCDANRERQETENRIAAEAFAQVESEHDIEREHILVLAGEGWHHGVIGIVASRVTEKYHLPCILFSFPSEENEGGIPLPTDEGKGSGRSIDGFCMIDALVDTQDLIVRFGGHAMAAGVTVTRENLPLFRERMETAAANAFAGGVPAPCLRVDCETDFSDINLRTAEEIFALEPYGCANPQPLFCLRGAKIETVSMLSGGKHTKLLISDPEDDTITRTPMVFGCHTEDFAYRAGDLIDLVYTLEVNEFRGERTAQMLVSDLHPAIDGNTFENRQTQAYRQIQSGTVVLPEGCLTASDMIPGREDCRAIWMYLREVTGGGVESASVFYRRIAFHTGVGMCRARLICDMFAQTGLLLCEKAGDDGFYCTLTAEQGKKIDLTAAPLYQNLLRLYGV